MILDGGHMQKSIIAALGLVALAAAASPAHAQAAHYGLLRADAGVTGSWTPSYGRGGFGGVLEVKLNVHDQIAVGARFDGQVMFGGNISPDGEDVSISVGVVASTLLKGEYFVSTGTVRPFLGVGAGLYDIVSQDVTTSNSSTSIEQVAGRYFGIAPSLGVDLGRLRLAATYNMILGADIEVRQNVGMANEVRTTFSQSYVAFEMSFRIGGNKKRPSQPLPPGGYYNPTGPYRPPVEPTPAQ
jgi:hypothetical protein